MPNLSRFSRASVFAVSTLALLAMTAGCHRGPQEGVVATVNGHPIMRTYLDKVYDAQLQNNPQQAAPSGDQADSLRLNILRELIEEELVDQRAAKEGLTATDAEVDAKLAEMKAPFTEDQFQQRLKDSGHTLEEVRHDLRRSLTQNKLQNKEINSKITVTDADVTNYFNAHKSEFNLPEAQYHLATIQVTSAPAQQAGNLQGSKATNLEEAQQKIKALKLRLDSGEDFGAIAANFSERPDSAPNGGDIGFIPQSQLLQMKAGDPATFNAIMALAPGQITPVIPLLDAKTGKPAGFAIYKLIAREPAGQRNLTDPSVQQAIRQQLHDGRSQLLKNAYFEMLHDQARIVNYLAEEIFRNDAK
jgi:peptidyl-prolyl cis-trans isomerase SurA